jgi:hypothetical protein
LQQTFDQGRQQAEFVGDRVDVDHAAYAPATGLAYLHLFKGLTLLQTAVDGFKEGHRARVEQLEERNGGSAAAGGQRQETPLPDGPLNDDQLNVILQEGLHAMVSANDKSEVAAVEQALDSIVVSALEGQGMARKDASHRMIKTQIVAGFAYGKDVMTQVPEDNPEVSDEILKRFERELDSMAVDTNLRKQRQTKDDDEEEEEIENGDD